MINEFRGKYYFLSNFYNAKVEWEGITYLNNESAFQSAKVLDKEVRLKFANLDPSSGKRKGRHVQLRYDWEKVKFNIMYEIVKAKFSQNQDLKEKLLLTGDEHLEEGNTWHDNLYGNCSCKRCENIKGQNKLGKILEKVREELRAKNI